MTKIKTRESFVLQRDEINLHKDSVDYLEEVFNRYSDGGLVGNNIVEKPIIHLYAKEDTTNVEGDLNGYDDALFFEAHIYDTKNEIKYTTRLHDSVDVGDTDIWQVKIFKDGSTMMQFYENYKFGNTTTLSMYKIRD